jgi:uncharacterized protein YbcV (DUF1398 family)
MEGNITLTEFYNALEAYSCSGENHTDPDGGDYYCSFEHRAMFKLLKILKERGISYQELYRSCDVNDDKDVNVKELQAVLSGLSAEFYQKDTQAIHNFFDIDKNGQCTDQEFLQQLAKAERLYATHLDRLAGNRPNTAGTLRGTMSGGFNDRDEGMNNYIPGFNQSSPRSQQEKLTSYLLAEFRAKNLLPERIFSMTDQGSGSVRFEDILNSIRKFMPTLTQDFLDQVPFAFGMDPKDELSKEEFKMLFDVKGGKRGGGPQDSALKQRNAQAARDANSEEYTTIIKYFAECLEEENLTPARFFKKADKNFNLVLTVDEIKDEIRSSLPNAFAGLNFKKLAKALDANNNGIIE